MRIQTKLRAGMSIWVALLSFPAMAGFVDMEPTPYTGGPGVKPTLAGGEGSTVQSAVGFGRDMPLPVGVSQILDAAGVKFEVDIPEAKRSSKITWESGPNWPAVLEKAVAPIGLQPVILWTEGKIRFVERKAALSAKPLMRFDIRKTDNFVSSALARWAKDAGWQLVWDTEVDLVVDADASYEGEFEQSIESLFNELSITKVPLKATLYHGNKVVRVSRYEGVNKQ